MTSLYKSTGGLITLSKGIESLDDFIVPGYYTDDKVDMHGHIIDKDAMIRALPEYMEWGTIREMHETPIGTAKSIGFPEWNYIEAKISDTSRGREAIEMVRAGVYKAFSVGIIVTDGGFVHYKELGDDAFVNISDDMRSLFEEYEYIFRITGLSLVENSIVDRPANPAARFKALSANYGVDGILPDTKSTESINAIKSMMQSSKFVIGDIHGGSATQAKDKVADSNNNASTVENMQTQKEASTVNQDNLDVSAETNDETQVTENADTKVTVEKETEASVSNDANSVDAVLSALEVTNNTIAEIGKRLDLFIDEVKGVLAEIQKGATVESETQVVTQPVIEESETNKQLIDVDSIASQVAEKAAEKLSGIIAVRKGVVTDEDVTEATNVPQEPTVKDMSLAQLRQNLGKIAAKRINRGA